MSLSKSCCAVFSLLVFLKVTQCIDVQSFCRDRCMRGSGGVLCRCDMAHFTGKRTLGSAAPSSSGALPPSAQQGVLGRVGGRHQGAAGTAGEERAEDYAGRVQPGYRGFPTFGVNYPLAGGLDTSLGGELGERKRGVEEGEGGDSGRVNTEISGVPSSVFLDSVVGEAGLRPAGVETEAYLGRRETATSQVTGDDDDNNDDANEDDRNALNGQESSWRRIAMWEKLERLLTHLRRVRQLRLRQHQQSDHRGYPASSKDYLPFLVFANEGLDPGSSPVDPASSEQQQQHEEEGQKHHLTHLQRVISRAFSKSLTKRSSRSTPTETHQPA